MADFHCRHVSSRLSLCDKVLLTQGEARPGRLRATEVSCGAATSDTSGGSDLYFFVSPLRLTRVKAPCHSSEAAVQPTGGLLGRCTKRRLVKHHRR